MSSCISSTSNGITLRILSDITLVIPISCFLAFSLPPYVLSVLSSCTSLLNFYGILSYLSLFLPCIHPSAAPHKHICTVHAPQSISVCSIIKRSGGSARNKSTDDRRDTLLLPCLSHVPHTFSLSSTMYHISKVILHRTTKVILLFSFYFPIPSPYVQGVSLFCPVIPAFSRSCGMR